MSAEDTRLTAARALLQEVDRDTVEAAVLEDLIAYAEERLRVNVGLLAENANLRKEAGK